MKRGIRYIEALRMALRDQLLNDPSVIVLGEDVTVSLRGITRGAFEEFGPARVLDTPLSEQAFTGFATGAALSGFRPVVEFQIPSLLYLAFDQIVNQAQKLSLMTGGQARVPVTYLIPGSGARNGLAGQHSDHPYNMLAHAGVKTVLPSTPEDAYGLLTAAIQDDDPVALFAPAAAMGIRSTSSPPYSGVPIGSGRIHRSGEDVTVVAIGHLVHKAFEVATMLEEEISIEILDPRTIYPLDCTLLSASVSKTRRLVVFDDSNRSGGFGAELIASVVERSSLASNPIRITRADATVPYAPNLEAQVLPSNDDLLYAIRRVME